MEIRQILEQCSEGRMSPEEAEKAIEKKMAGYRVLPGVRVDEDRKRRTGHAEVVFCQGKPDRYLPEIYRSIYEREGEVLGTRAERKQYELVRQTLPQVAFDPVSRILKIEKEKEKKGLIAVCTGGTSDIPVAEEAAQTAEFMGSRVERIYDVGVAGLHRLLDQRELLERATVVVAVAGMEGALASVTAGLLSVPVIAVPTSVGYGASFGGVAALLGMLNSCSSGVGTVNIDNGYGAGYLANQINQATVIM